MRDGQQRQRTVGSDSVSVRWVCVCVGLNRRRCVCVCENCASLLPECLSGARGSVRELHRTPTRPKGGRWSEAKREARRAKQSEQRLWVQIRKVFLSILTGVRVL